MRIAQTVGVWVIAAALGVIAATAAYTTWIEEEPPPPEPPEPVALYGDVLDRIGLALGLIGLERCQSVAQAGFMENIDVDDLEGDAWNELFEWAGETYTWASHRCSKMFPLAAERQREITAELEAELGPPPDPAD